MNDVSSRSKAAPTRPRLSTPRANGNLDSSANGMSASPNQAQVVARLKELGASERVIELAKKAIR